MCGKRRSSRLAEKHKANSLDQEAKMPKALRNDDDAMKRTRKAESSKANLVEEVAVPGKELETPAALLNDVVLQNIFKYLGYEDLKTIRDVKNTVWLRNSKNAWWSRTKVTLKETKVEEYLNQTELHPCAKNYELKNFEMSEHEGFWERLGHSIKYLELTSCELSSAEDFRQIFYTKCPNLEKLVARDFRVFTDTVVVEPMEWQEPQFGQQKNLKSLEINISFERKPFGCGRCILMPVSWMELLSHFPNLEALETNAKTDIYKVISIIRQHDPKMLKLKHIDIQNDSKALQSEIDYEDSLRRVLLDPNLSFESLHIDNGISQLETLVDILDLHANSLKELFISGDIAEISNEISLRRPLLNLETLSLICCLFTADILRYTPNLRKFNLIFGQAPNLSKCPDSNLRINSCKELKIWSFLRSGDLPNSDLQFFLNAFPNVETLEISGLDNLKFSMICERWTRLVKLIGNLSEVDAAGLLGFDPDSKTKEERNPNISNLKSLQLFFMAGKTVLGEEMNARGGIIQIKMKNADIVLKELETLPRLKKFELIGYLLENKELWFKIFEKYFAISGKIFKI